MSEYELHLGDCLDVLPTIQAQSVDCVCADIPSGRTNCAWDSVIPFEPMWEQLRRITKPRGAIVLLGCTQPFTSALVMSNVKQFKYSWVWEKPVATGFLDAKKRPLRAHEDIVVFSDSEPAYSPVLTENGTPSRQGRARKESPDVYRKGIRNVGGDGHTWRYPRSVVKFSGVNSLHERLHPTQKPLALLEYLIRTYTNAGDLVLDFCYGSGTTGAACGNLCRRFVGIERDEHYFNLGSERIATAFSPLRMMEAAS